MASHPQELVSDTSRGVQVHPERTASNTLVISSDTPRDRDDTPRDALLRESHHQLQKQLGHPKDRWTQPAPGDLSETLSCLVWGPEASRDPEEGGPGWGHSAVPARPDSLQDAPGPVSDPN